MARLKTLGAAAVILAAGASTTAIAQEFEQDWAGFYAGIHADGTAYSVDISDPNNSFLSDHPQLSFLLGGGGVTGGYNYFLENNLVVSGELDWTSELAIDEFVASNADRTTGVQYDLRMTGVTQLRGRAGFVQGNALGYITAGIAQAQTEFETYAVDPSPPGSGPAQESCETSNCARTTEPLLGLTVGAGMDWAFRENWVGRVEVQHMVFESIQVPILDPSEALLCASVSQDQCSISYQPASTSIRFGITYMFE